MTQRMSFGHEEVQVSRNSLMLYLPMSEADMAKIRLKYGALTLQQDGFTSHTKHISHPHAH